MTAGPGTAARAAPLLAARAAPLLAVVAGIPLAVAPPAAGQTFAEPAVWERMMRADGRGVRDQDRPVSAPGALRPAETVVTLDSVPPPAERDAIVRHVRGGGRLVAAGASAGQMAVALGVRLRPVGSGPDWTRRVRAAETSPAARLDVAAAPAGWRVRARPGVRALYADRRGRAGVVRVRAGAGVAVLVATSAPVRDRELLRAENAAFALAALGPGRDVVFGALPGGASGTPEGGGGAEGGGAGGGGGGGEGATPPPPADEDGGAGLPLALLLGLLTAGALVWSGRRLGPPAPPPVDADPARGVYAAAVGTALAATGDARGAVAGSREAARRLLALRSGVPLGREPPEDVLAGAARRAGLSPDEVDAVLDRPDHDPLAVGRGLARLRGGAA